MILSQELKQNENSAAFQNQSSRTSQQQTPANSQTPSSQNTQVNNFFDNFQSGSSLTIKIIGYLLKHLSESDIFILNGSNEHFELF